MLHLVGILSSRFAHDARSQEHKTFELIYSIFCALIRCDSLYKLYHCSPIWIIIHHVSSMYITPLNHIPNKYLTSDILYSSLLFYYSALNVTKNCTIIKLWNDLETF